jgi:hypothetical protein
MKTRVIAALVLAALPGTVLPSLAQAPRKDYVWARSTAGAPLTLDGRAERARVGAGGTRWCSR